MIGALSPATILLLLSSVTCQVAGLVLLPVTRGFTAPLPTLGSIAGFVVGLGLLARMSHNGVDIGVIVPLTSTLIPLCVIAAGVFLYGESASLMKICLLVVACGPYRARVESRMIPPANKPGFSRP
jgi:multidrug transporter EmrE-like cation transporter